MSLKRLLLPDFGGVGELKTVSVFAQPGDVVTESKTLAIFKARKKCFIVSAPKSGLITDVSINKGDKVAEGFLLFEMET